MPFCQSSIVAPRPVHPHRWKCTQVVPRQPQTIGEHLKAHRLALHLFQSVAAKQLGVDKASVQNWERGIFQPVPRYFPAIIRFLGYVPFTHDGTVAGQTRWLRMCAGWNQQELAAAVECGDVTIWRWETGQPCDRRLWSRGVVCLQDRLQRLGLAPLTTAEIETLKAMRD